MGEPIKEEDITVLFGCCCCNLGLYRGPCVGCSSETQLCCIEHSCCLKPGADFLWCGCGGGDGKWIQIGLGCCAVSCGTPTTCVKGQGQLCCLVDSCAFPPDDEVPATLACFGLACMPKCGCCVRLGGPGGAPTAEVMAR